jgi:hypothetical protein
VRRGGLSRRQVPQGGGIAVMGAGGLTLAGIAGYAWPHDQAAAASIPDAPVTPDDARGVLHFVTRPDLTPAALTIARHDGAGAASPEYFILAPGGYPRAGPGVPGLMIMDRGGGIVWYAPNTGFPASKGQGRMDLKVQTYRGKPVLTWWEGQVIKGYGEGMAVIADSSYRTIATVHAGNGLICTSSSSARRTPRGPVVPGLHRGLGRPPGGQARRGRADQPGRGFGRVRELERVDRAGHVDGPGREDGG